MKDDVRALLDSGNFELVGQAQELWNLCEKSAKVKVGCEVVGAEGVPRLRVIEFTI